MRLRTFQRLSWRLTIAYTALVTAGLLVFGAVAFLGVRYVLLSVAARQTETSMATVLQALDVGADNQGDYSGVDLGGPALVAAGGDGAAWIQLIDSSGEVISRSANAEKGMAIPPYVGPAVRVRLGDNLVMIAGGRLRTGATLQVARPLEREEEFLSSLLQVLLVVGLVCLVPAVLGGRAIASRALRPIETVTRATREITINDLGRRVPLHGPRDELHVLGETLNGMLERLDDGFRRQREFVAAASHDLRTPLAVIHSYNELLARWGGSDPKVVAESSRAISGALSTVERLVHDLLLLAQIDIGPKLDFSVLRLDSLVEEIAREARAVAPNVEVAETVSAVVEVLADETYLRRAVWNLVDNALKYGGGKMEIITGRQGNEAALTVADNGSGLTPEERSQIFERFYRADQARSRGKGFGLGLPIAKAIVEAHHGRIEVQSEPGLGARFTVLLPAAPTAPETLRGSPGRSREGSDRP